MRLPILGDIVDLNTDLVRTFAERRRKDGPVATLRLGPTDVKLISDADLIERLLIGKCASKSRYTKMMSAAFGDSLVITEGESWRRQRKYLQPHFGKRSLANWAPYIEKETSRAITAWAASDNHELFDAHREASRLVQSIMGEILFGDLFPKDKVTDLMATAKGISEGLFTAFLRNSILVGPLRHLPTPGRVSYERHLKTFSDFINELYEIEIPDGHPSLAAAIINSVEPNPEGRREVKDQIGVLYFAGHDTTAKALAWTLYFLCQHGEWVARIREDADTNSFSLNSSRSALAVIKETMRLRPPAYGIERKTDVDVIHGNTTLQKDTITPISVIDVQKAPEYWPDPTIFDPTRFLDHAPNGLKKCAYIPFGHGPRKCIGMDLAMLELEHIVTSICQRTDFASPNWRSVEPKAAVTLGLRPPLELRFAKRKTL